MKRTGSGLLLIALALTGCDTLPVLNSDAPAPQAARPEIPPAPPPTVTPDQITEHNAPEMVNRLREELDYSASTREAPLPNTVEKNR